MYRSHSVWMHRIRPQKTGTSSLVGQIEDAGYLSHSPFAVDWFGRYQLAT